MSLNPKILPDADGVYWLHWTPDPTAGGYAFTTPTGASRSFNKTLSKTKLGKHAEPVVATVAALDVSARAPETATYPAVVEPPPPAPRLSIDAAGKLSWTATAGATDYELAEISPSGAATHRRLGNVLSVTPSAHPGETWMYDVSAVPGGVWYGRVSRAWEGTAPPPPPLPSGGFEFAFQIRRDMADVPLAASLALKVTRVEFGASSAATALDAYVAALHAKGIRAQPLAGFHNRTPDAGDVAQLRSWGLRFGLFNTFWEGKTNPLPITHIEFGNETSYAHQAPDMPAYEGWAQNYARRAKEAAISLQGTGVGLIIQLDSASGWPWIENMKKAVPDLDKYAAGWSMHTYGPNGVAAALDNLRRARVVGWSDSVPVFITEWGFATDNGRSLTNNYGWPVNQTYAQAAAAMKSEVPKYRQQVGARLRQIMVYMSRDLRPSGSTNEREDYFGVFQSNGAEKGAFTVEALAQAAV